MHVTWLQMVSSGDKSSFKINNTVLQKQPSKHLLYPFADHNG
jgi:hypothetical protein